VKDNVCLLVAKPFCQSHSTGISIFNTLRRKEKKEKKKKKYQHFQNIIPNTQLPNYDYLFS